MDEHPRVTDDDIRKMAKARVEFKKHLVAYIIINAMLIGIWYTTSQISGMMFHWATFWPIWPLIGWGVGVAFHGFDAYSDGRRGMMAKEEAKLRQKYG